MSLDKNDLETLTEFLDALNDLSYQSGIRLSGQTSVETTRSTRTLVRSSEGSWLCQLDLARREAADSSGRRNMLICWATD
jgi:hypothetical protein